MLKDEDVCRRRLRQVFGYERGKGSDCYGEGPKLLCVNDNGHSTLILFLFLICFDALDAQRLIVIYSRHY